MILEGSGGLLLSKEEVEKNAANIGSNKMMNTHGEIRFVAKISTFFIVNNSNGNK